MMIIAAYDVSQDSRRARLAALLQSFGDRLQRSVFALQVTEVTLGEIRTRASAIIDPDTDSLFLVRQCSTCWETIECIGQASPPEPVLFWAAM